MGFESKKNDTNLLENESVKYKTKHGDDVNNGLSLLKKGEIYNNRGPARLYKKTQ